MFGNVGKQKYDEIPAGIETCCGESNLLAMTANVQNGKETIMEMQIDLHLWRNSNVERRQIVENAIYW